MKSGSGSRRCSVPRASTAWSTSHSVDLARQRLRRRGSARRIVTSIVCPGQRRLRVLSSTSTWFATGFDLEPGGGGQGGGLAEVGGVAGQRRRAGDAGRASARSGPAARGTKVGQRPAPRRSPRRRVTVDPRGSGCPPGASTTASARAALERALRARACAVSPGSYAGLSVATVKTARRRLRPRPPARRRRRRGRPPPPARGRAGRAASSSTT